MGGYNSINQRKNVYLNIFGWDYLYAKFKTFQEQNYIHSKLQLQHPLSTTHGQWTMIFVTEACNGFSHRNILK